MNSLLWDVDYHGQPDSPQCLHDKFNITGIQSKPLKWQCPITLISYSADSTLDLVDRHNRPCGDHRFDLIPYNWMLSETDTNLRAALKGGIDNVGIHWEGARAGETFAETVGRQFWNTRGTECTRRFPCKPTLSCAELGSFTAISLGKNEQPMKLPWVLFVSSALSNINQQLVNQYDQLEHAIESMGLDTFAIDDFFHKEDQDYSLQYSLSGLSGIFTILGGFIPGAAPALDITSGVASSIGSFLTTSVSPQDPLEAQTVFSEKVLTLYRELLGGMETVIAKLFRGDPIPGPGPGSIRITDMMAGGAWVNATSLTNVSELN